MGKIIRRILTIIPAVALQSLWLLLLMKWLTPYAPIIVSLLSVAAFFLVVFIIIKRDETAYKLLWLLVILSLPLVGALLYLLFGNKRTARPLKRRLQQVQKSCNPQPLPIKEAPFDGEKRMGQTVRWLEEKTQYNSKLAAVVKSDTVLVDFKMTALDYLRAERRNIKFGEQDTSRSWQPTVTVTLADDSEYPVKGIVDFADPIVDPQTGTFGVRAELSNPNQKLLPGQFTKVKLLLDVRERAIVVPRKAISIEKGGAFIYVVRRDNVAEKRFVQTGPEIGNNIVIERGLGENEQVVIEGYHKLVPGMLVQPIQAGDDKAIEALRAEEEEE